MDQHSKLHLMMEQSKKTVKAYVADEEAVRRARSAYGNDVSNGSMHGEVLYGTGGIIIDDWIRVYGSGTIDTVGRNKAMPEPLPWMAVAEDVIGGVYVLQDGQIAYLAPDTLEMEGTGVSYDDFISWCLFGDTDQYYAGFRQEGWRDWASGLTVDQGLAVVPLPCVDAKSRAFAAVPMQEVLGLIFELRKQLAKIPDGEQVQFAVRDDAAPSV